MSSGTSSSELRALPLFDVCVDLHHPATSFATSKANGPIHALFIAPPTAFIDASRVVGQEVVSPNGLEKLARFAFPEFSDQQYAQEVSKAQPIPMDGASAGLNKYDVYGHDFYGGACSTETRISSFYPYITTSGPTYHSFAMQLTTGDRVYGHVRRYLPKHVLVHSRNDLGRRAVRALIILTRHTAGDKFFHSVLKTLETLISLEETVRRIYDHKQLLNHTLHTLFEKHYRLCTIYNSSRLTLGAPLGQTEPMVKANANIITLPMLEFQSAKVEKVDSINFVVPQTLLHPYLKDDSFQPSASLILPLFRCLGVSNSLRLFSALLCERRVILISRSPSRLSACGRAAMAILAQGLLHWQHVYIPVAPTGMIAYLATPVPYLIGVLSNQANLIPKVLGLGEVVTVNLDENKLQTHNMTQDPNIAIPDLLRPSIENPNESNNGIGVDNSMSPADVLASELIAILKTDKKFLSFGEAGVQEVLGNVAEKGKKLLQRGFGKLKGIMSATSDVVDDNPIGPSDSMDGDGGGQEIDNGGDSPVLEEHNFAWGEGSENEAGEEEVRIAFTVFFLSLLGDIRWYVRAPPAGSTDPVYDKDLFLQSRRSLGDREGTPIYQLLTIFRETQIFQQFVTNRIDDVLKKKPVLLDAPLYSLAFNYHRNKRVPFTVNEIRHFVRQMSQYNSSRFIVMWTSNARKRAMFLTSNNRDEASAIPEIKRLVNDSRESTIILVDIMGVVWERIRTCRGMQFKHGLYALQLLRELILNGPLSAVSDALEGLGKIKKLMNYENMRSGVAQQIRRAARDLCYLLMNRAKLFQQRRFLAIQRNKSDAPVVIFKRVDRVNFSMEFSKVHLIMKPAGLLVQPTPDFLSGAVPASSAVVALSQTVDLLSIQSDQSNILMQPMAPNNMYPSQQQAYYGVSVPLQQQFIVEPNASVPQPSKGNLNFDPFA